MVDVAIVEDGIINLPTAQALRGELVITANLRYLTLKEHVYLLTLTELHSLGGKQASFPCFLIENTDMQC
jgi:hypothetical protein